MRFIKSFAGGVALLAIAGGCASTAETGQAAAKPAAVPQPMAAVKASVQADVAATVAKQATVGSNFDKPGFQTLVKDGRLWVFADGSKSLDAYKSSGKTPAVHTVRPNAGPMGMTIIAPESETIVDYLVSKPGFHTMVKDGRLWVFADGSKSLDAYKSGGKTPAVHTVRPKAGPMGMTIIAPESETIVDYLVAKPGFHTMVKDGRLWVFAEGSKELVAFKTSGKTPAVHTVRPKAGPMGMTIISPDSAVLDAYMK